VNKAGLKRLANKLFKKSNFHVNVCLDSVCHFPLPVGAHSATGFFYDCPMVTLRHLDGSMSGTFLTVLVGQKEWKIFSPNGKKVYSCVQKPKQTVYLPAGYSHEVTTTSQKSIAYGGLWEVPQEEVAEKICANRTYLRTQVPSLQQKLNLAEAVAERITPTRGLTAIDKMLLSAGRRHAITKKGSTRRYRDGRIRKPKLGTIKKRHRKK
jgi:hypothetical protein